MSGPRRIYPDPALMMAARAKTQERRASMRRSARPARSSTSGLARGSYEPRDREIIAIEPR